MAEPEASSAPLRRAVEAPSAFLIGPHPDRCIECWGCVRVCPARALRIVDGHSEVITERCVKCGRCVVSCGNAAHEVRDDTGRVRELLRSGRPVVALLATEAVAALYPRTLADVEHQLELLGFKAVETTVLGEELVAEAYERVHARTDGLPALRSTCPVTVEWVRRYHPQLTGTLVPIVPPYIAHARLIRELYPGDIAVVYVSPCFARKDEVYEPDVAGVVDVAIDFSELQQLLAGVPERPRATAPRDARRPQAVKQLSVTDGFPRRTLESRSVASGEIVTVRGLESLDRLLSAIANGETAPPIVDMLLCDGCIDGPAVAPQLSVYAKRGIAAADRTSRGPAIVQSRDLLATLPSVELTRSFVASPALRQIPTPAEIDASLAEGGFASRAQTIDCGACGFPTCVEHAEAVVRGDSNWDMCFPRARRQITELADELERHATRDPLTGLYNRRALDERLAQEVARARRAETSLSLVVVDIDRFKIVNDEHGHAAGDAALRTIARLLERELRASDIACRFGGDEFAIILPDTGKTEAFAVAEKLRSALASTEIGLLDGDSLSETASFGVAALGPSATDATALFVAADRALYEAKRSGGNRTYLAAG